MTLAVRDYLRAQQLPEATAIRLTFKGACCYVAGNDTAADVLGRDIRRPIRSRVRQPFT